MSKIRGMKRIFRGDGKTLVVAIDHGIFNEASAGSESPGKTTEQIIADGADAVLVNFGVACQPAAELSGINYIACLDLPSTYLGVGHNNRVAFDAEYVLRARADAIMINVGQGQGVKEPTYPYLSHAIQQYDEMRTPVCAEAVPGGFDSGKELKTLDHIARSMQVACEIGCDFVKVSSAPGFEHIIQETFVPLIAPGGTRTDDARGFFALIHGTMDAGAGGVAISRNIRGVRNIVGMTRTLAAIVHENAGTEEAYEILQSVK